MIHKLKTPAKINLTLDVLHKREDGYHEIEMVMTTIDLADRLELKCLADSRIEVNSSVSYVPSNESNLAYQAAKLLQDRFRVQEGVSIFIDKQIPVAAGLAGGSSNAAGTIRGLNKLWRLNLSVEEMAILGAEIGSDVSFCIYGGTALAKGRGEHITPLPALPPCWIVLVKPPMGVSTGEIYKRLNLNTMERPSTSSMIAALDEADLMSISNHLGNVLESVTLKEYPQVAHIKQQMQRFGATKALMSGSGPTVFTLTKTESQGQRIVNGLKGFCKDVYLVRSLSL